MKHSTYRWVSIIFIYIILAFQGCGWKPVPGVPRDVTISQVLASIENYSSGVNDLSARADVRAQIDGHTQSATVDIRYINPDLFRIYIKGFAGIDVARISALKDSMVVYLPSENVYITAGRDENILGLLIPEFDINMKSFESIFNGTLPLTEEREEFQISMKHSGRQVELTLKHGETMYLYAIEGPDLRLVDEKIICDNVPVWHKTFSEYDSFNGVDFPVKITIERGRDIFKLNFTKCVINSGLTDRDLSFNIPSSAERVFIEKRR